MTLADGVRSELETISRRNKARYALGRSARLSHSHMALQRVRAGIFDVYRQFDTLRPQLDTPVGGPQFFPSLQRAELIMEHFFAIKEQVGEV